MEYYGHYKSSAVFKGCVKEFVTTSSNNLMFPPHLNYFCDMCNETHGFKLSHTQMVVNANTAKQFDEFCNSHHIERDVEIPH